PNRSSHLNLAFGIFRPRSHFFFRRWSLAHGVTPANAPRIASARANRRFGRRGVSSRLESKNEPRNFRVPTKNCRVRSLSAKARKRSSGAVKDFEMGDRESTLPEAGLGLL